MNDNEPPWEVLYISGYGFVCCQIQAVDVVVSGVVLEGVEIFEMSCSWRISIVGV